MPIKECQIDGKYGYKWGNDGKCYTGPDARKKALQQGIAIEIGKLSDNKISFDYDETLTKDSVQNKVKELIKSGSIIYIISARRDKEPMLKLAGELGISSDKVFATGSNMKKIEKIKSLGIKTHYDNNADVINKLKDININGILV